MESSVTHTLSAQDLAGYEAARRGAVVYAVPQVGVLDIGGADQDDFVQRQTTNDVRALTPALSQATVLTSPTARILDVWRLLREPDAIRVITLPGRAPATARFLRSRIFFRDQVTVSDVSAEFALLELAGPQANDVLRGAGFDVPGENQVLAGAWEGLSVRLVGLSGGRTLLLAQAGDTAALSDRLAAAGAVPLSAPAYGVLRVEEGVPGPAHELTEDYTPLEMHLSAAISTTKGCYTGQEVIARQISYDKITRGLCGLRLAAAVRVSASVQAEGRTVGQITSAAVSPRVGPIALAVIKRPHHAPGTAISVSEGEGASVRGEVSALPLA